MRRKLTYFLLLNMLSLALSTPVLAKALYPLSAQKEAQFNHLLKNLRCLVCQNQDLADSNATLARDLKQQVYTMVQAGNSDGEVIAYLTQRYGDFILFKPPFKPLTWLLWLGPFVFLTLGIIVVWRTCSRRVPHG
ncbi:MAG: cytochrome C biogenesis protein [Legionellaceae bacterium]|nr:cytochrome C biogenesis protein [Legionellaceae bacterium]HAF87871.1 cytochrome c-type biogenesis protein CcmH [Legionellales bacterium]HCA89492.1 cytochrome c-type biogenesis protein CcmH [Legionellales bacterium]|tara:strand:+ start:3434 stop:3838 length:405 start_codon:yes stop_codon:yes gene_type:complete